MQAKQALWFIALLAALAGCSHHVKQPENAWHIGNTVTVEGTAGNEKLGAVLLLDNGTTVWIDRLEEWPFNCFSGDGKGKRLVVTGTLTVRHDLPAYVQKPGEPPKSGIPVGSEEELKDASSRYVLTNATWVIRD